MGAALWDGKAGVDAPETTVESRLSTGRVGLLPLGLRSYIEGEWLLSLAASSRIGLDARLATRLAVRLPMTLEGRVAGGVLSAVPGVDGNGDAVLVLSLLEESEESATKLC